MIYPDVKLEDWLKKYPGLEPQKGKCSCGKTGMTTLPIITSEWVGLAMPQCLKCGNETPALIFKARSKDLQSEMNSLLK